jgi:hypothetical protein
MAPWHAARSIRRALLRYGPGVRDEFGTPLAHQLKALTSLRFRCHFEPSMYYQFRFFTPERRQRASRYLQARDVGTVLRWLVRRTPGYPPVFRDKREFYKWCARLDLPTVQPLLHIEPGQVRQRTPVLPDEDLFSKPTNAQGGLGAALWRSIGNGRYAAADGRARSTGQLLDALSHSAAAFGRPFILQRRLTNADSLADLSPLGLCTARVMTVRAPGEDPRILLAVLRMPTATAVADNFDQGGLAARVNLRSGRLDAALRKHPRFYGRPFEVHPDTGAAISGRQLPHWPDALSLVLRAHAAIDWPGVPVVGWDVAFANGGPLLLEGNNIPCSALAQMPSGIPLADTPFLQILHAHLRERCPT